MENQMKKRCPKCEKTKPRAAFSKDHQRKSGLQVWCKACRGQRVIEHRQANQDKYRATQAKWRKIHPNYAAEWRRVNWKKIRANTTKWRKDNPDREKKWKKDNPDKVCNYSARRRALRKGAATERVSREIVYERERGICHICGRAVFHENWHLDHIIPLSKGGDHSYRNVAVSHPACNMRKAAS